jgi:hypothetical protein
VVKKEPGVSTPHQEKVHMEIELKGTSKREHVSQTVAQVLIHAGLATEVKPDPLTQCVKETEWQAFSPTFPEYPPYIRWNCPNCRFGGEIAARDILTNLVRPVKHGAGCRGHEEFIPSNIVARFKDLYKAWENRSKPQPKVVENPRRFFFQKVG